MTTEKLLESLTRYSFIHGAVAGVGVVVQPSPEGSYFRVESVEALLQALVQRHREELALMEARAEAAENEQRELRRAYVALQTRSRGALCSVEARTLRDLVRVSLLRDQITASRAAEILGLTADDMHVLMAKWACDGGV